MNPQQTFTSLQAPSGDNQGRPWVAFAAGFVTLVLLVAALLLWNNSARTPDAIFRGAFSRALSTNSVRQVTLSGDGTVTVSYDVSNVKNPRLSSQLNSLTIDAGPLEQISGYSTFSNTYIKFTGGLVTTYLPSNAVNKWIQTRTNGTSHISAASTGLVSDAQQIFFGNIVFGNFSRKDRGTIMDYIAKHPLYTYDTKQVTKTIVNNHHVFAYDVKTNEKNLEGYNKLIGTIVGQQPEITSSDYDQLAAGSTIIYIDSSSKEIIKGKTQNTDGSTTTTTYDQYDQAQVGTEPKAQLSWDTFSGTGATL